MLWDGHHCEVLSIHFFFSNNNYYFLKKFDEILGYSK